MEDLHPRKYVELLKKLQQEAKSEYIRLLSDYTDSHIVMSDEPGNKKENLLDKRKIESNRIEFKKGWNQTSIYHSVRLRQ